MIVTSVVLQNFRSYAKRTVTFSPKTTLIIGPNAAGKTNILESLYLLGVGKSFRADETAELIAWGTQIGRIKGTIGETVLELLLVSAENTQGGLLPGKKYLVNGIGRRVVDFLGNLRVVLFWPQDLDLVVLTPSVRRRYLDSVLVQVDREYRRTLISYERGLRQRNKLLDAIHEGVAQRSQLLFWNQLLISAGEYITQKRESFIAYVNAHKHSIGRYQLTYDKSVISTPRLEQYADEEVAAKATLVGPHRDDVIFTMKTEANQAFVDVSKFGSRGEQRLAVLFLKLAELSFMKETLGDSPILLLDDIFSELDPAHRSNIFDIIGNQQTIMTTTDKTNIPKELLEEMQIIELQ